jgi:homoserine O-succinyltransferase/O-acetyltransferase
MPICLDREQRGPGLATGAVLQNGGSNFDFRESEANCLEIGLVNNMPSAALEATERQFRARLEAAADGLMVRLTYHALPEVPRSEAGQRHVSGYVPLQDLWNQELDGLIVTGTEPRAPGLKDEPYWKSLTGLVEWAERHTHSAIWSCLAAHVAVLHLDGVVRRRLAGKCCGVFECEKAGNHALTGVLPPRLHMPHSRWNELPEEALAACGYRILTRSKDAGTDAFIKQRNSLFVFFQGHPEYEADTLLLEYRRDVGRFLRGERDVYPSLPHGYFDEETTGALIALRKRALAEQRPELLAEFPSAAAAQVRNTWQCAAAAIYRRWLFYLRARKEQRLRARRGWRESTKMGPASVRALRQDLHRNGTL